jgi:hypothetical protein
MHDSWKYKHTKPDSLAVLRDEKSTPNDKLWALRYMQEPLSKGGTQKDQDLYVQILTTIAQGTDAHYQDESSRLTAVEVLSHYKDPRVAPSLLKAFDNPPGKHDPLLASIFRQKVLAGLGETGAPEARELLIQVARAGAKEATQGERSNTLDERLHALRGLGHYNQYDSIDTLYQVMTMEKDVALRERAYLSLEEATGKHLPPDPKKWDKLLHGTPQEREAVAREGSGGVLNLVGWWH